MTATIRYWLHDNQWRIQTACQIADRNGVLQDGYHSLAIGGQVLMFNTEEMAREYHEKMKESSNGKIEN